MHVSSLTQNSYMTSEQTAELDQAMLSSNNMVIDSPEMVKALHAKHSANSSRVSTCEAMIHELNMADAKPE